MFVGISTISMMFVIASRGGTIHVMKKKLLIVRSMMPNGETLTRLSSRSLLLAMPSLSLATLPS